jgi:hypothetical protein
VAEAGHRAFDPQLGCAVVEDVQLAAEPAGVGPPEVRGEPHELHVVAGEQQLRLLLPGRRDGHDAVGDVGVGALADILRRPEPVVPRVVAHSALGAVVQSHHLRKDPVVG